MKNSPGGRSTSIKKGTAQGCPGGDADSVPRAGQMAGPGWPAPCCPLVTSVEDADYVVAGHHDDVIVLEVHHGVFEHLPGDHNVGLFMDLLVESEIGDISWLKERKERYDALLISFRTLCYAIAQERFWRRLRNKSMLPWPVWHHPDLR